MRYSCQNNPNLRPYVGQICKKSECEILLFLGMEVRSFLKYQNFLFSLTFQFYKSENGRPWQNVE